VRYAVYDVVPSDEERTAQNKLPAEPLYEAAAWSDAEPETIGRFEIVGPVGKGAMGTVYEASDPATKARVAIKIITRISPEGLYRFKKEFRALARIQHPNVVSLYELAQHHEQLFYTMELVRGVDLLRYLCGPPISVRPKRYRPCRDYDKLRGALRQLASGIDAIHRAGFLHRDIKPTNVVVARDGRVVLLDFGLVRDQRIEVDAGLTDDGAVLGTPLYMSPEQAVGRDIDRASDWYSLGALLYHALCGGAPFQGTGVLALLASKRDEMPPHPRSVVPEVPEDLATLCWELIATDQKSRADASRVLDALGLDQDDADPVAADAALFLGRDDELETLRGALSTAMAGQPVLALVDGVSGMGKSALVQRFLDEIRGDPGTVVLSGKCSERESIPYKAMDSVMDALSDFLRSRPSNSEARALLPRDALAVARLFPVLLSVPAVALAPQKRGDDRTDPAEQRRRAFAALRELLGRLSDERRLVIYIDDLQWSDVDSMQLLDAILRHSDAPRMLVVGTFRPGADEGDGPLARLVSTLSMPGAAVPIRRVHVGPIDAAASTDLALRMLGARTHRNRELAEEVAREAEGSPFFVGELVRYARRVQAESDGPAGADSLVSLDNVIRHRIEGLPTDARRLLDVIAVAGGRVSLGVAVQVATGDTKDRKAVARLRADHLVRMHGPSESDSIETYHDRIRETALKNIGRDALPQIHLELGRALETDSGPDAIALSHHFRQAGEDQLATRYTIKAAQQAAEALAFDRAAELFRIALDLRALPEAEIPELEASLADVLANAGHLYESAMAYLRATSAAPQDEHFEWTRRAAEHLLTSGHADQGRKVLDQVLQSVGLSVPRSNARAIGALIRHRMALSIGGMRIRLRHLAEIKSAELQRVDACWTASRGLLFTDGIVAADFHAQALRAALKTGEPVRIIRSIAFEAQTIAALGGSPKYEKAMALLEQTRTLADKLDSPYAAGMVRLFEGHIGMHVGRWSSALEHLRAAVEILRAECNYVMPEIAYCEAHAALCLLFMGQIRQLGSVAPMLLERSLARANPYVEGYARGLMGNVVSLAPDDVDEAREQLAIYRRDAPKRFEGHMLNYIAQSAALDRYEGNPMAAVERAKKDGPQVAKLMVLRTPQARAEWLLWRGTTALAGAAASSEATSLLAEVDKVVAELVKHGSPFARGYGRLMQAGTQGLREQEDAAVKSLRAAVEEFEASDMEGFAAAARVRLAELIGGSEADGLHASAAAYYTREGVRRPEHFVRMRAPGFKRE